MGQNKLQVQQSDINGLSPINLILRNAKNRGMGSVSSIIVDGIMLADAKAMISYSPLYSQEPVARVILGELYDVAETQKEQLDTLRMSLRQSSVAYQYAEALEYAADVFGALAIAERWLARQNRYLNGESPIFMLRNYAGYNSVMQYLMRVNYGIYI